MERNRFPLAARIVLLVAASILLGGVVVAQSQEPREENVRSLIKKFADARNAHDGSLAASLYSDDGVWMQRDGIATVRHREELARMWGGLRGNADRKVTSIEFPGPNIAVVKVRVDYDPPIGPGHFEVFILIKERGSDWKISIHQTLN